MPKFRVDQYLSLLCFSVALVVTPSSSLVRELSAQAVTVSTPSIPAQLVKSVEVPVYQTGDLSAVELPDMTAPAVYVMDRESGAILYHKDDELARYPASTAKMMTALVARKIYSLDQTFTIQEEAFTTGSTAGLKLGEKMTVRELMYALLIPSGNDAAFVFANHHPLGYQGFIDQMNQTAQELHLEHTTFRNVSGLDIEGESSTARDLAILANEVMKDPFLRQIVGTKQTLITDTTGTIPHVLNSTQELLGVVPGVVGIKTGTTDFAGENLITEVDRDGHQVIFVVLGSKDRFSETKELIDWVFANYHWEKIEHPSSSPQ